MIRLALVAGLLLTCLAWLACLAYQHKRRVASCGRCRRLVEARRRVRVGGRLLCGPCWSRVYVALSQLEGTSTKYGSKA